MRGSEIAAAAGLATVGVVAAAVTRRRRSLGEPSFTSRFIVPATLEAVARFHADPRALTKLTPPPTVMRVHRMDPLAEGSVSEFTMWVGPIPIRWRAVHSGFKALKGFTDTQELGPMARWIHRHSYRALGDGHADGSNRSQVEYRAYLLT